MPRKARELGPLAVSRLTQPGLYMVGGVAGLALQVLPSGGRTWILRATIGNRRREMGLGGFPDVTLARAREAAREARDAIRRGIDPMEAGRDARRALKEKPQASMTFRSAAQAYIASHEASWKNAKHRSQWTATLDLYAYPVLGEMDVSRIELPQILQVLEPIWTTKTETAKRLRGRLEMILDWATAREFRSGPTPHGGVAISTSSWPSRPRSDGSSTIVPCRSMRCPPSYAGCVRPRARARGAWSSRS